MGLEKLIQVQEQSVIQQHALVLSGMQQFERMLYTYKKNNN